MARFYGQGATEYLVLLAVVLIIALVSIALLGFFPGMATDTKITQSMTYWSGQAYPLSIQAVKMMAAGGNTCQIVVQNMDSANTLTLGNIRIGTNNNATTVSLAPGETKTLLVTSTACSPGTTVDVAVGFTYNTTSGLLNVNQNGSKTLTTKCQ